jgi:hypothetical protein
MNIAEKLKTVAENEQKVYDAGKKAEYDAFWDSIPLEDMNQLAFSGYAWNDTTFRPNRDIVFIGGGGSYSFASNNISNIKANLNECGVKLDVSKMTSLGYCFRILKTSELPELDFRGVKNFSGLAYAVCNNSNLETIDKIILPNEWSAVGNAASFLTSNPKLVNITFEGTIPGSINLSNSPLLSVESLKSLIKSLAHYYGTDKEFTYTLTVKASAWEALEAAGFTNEDYRWILDTWGGNPTTVESWDALMGGWIGWNLVLA